MKQLRFKGGLAYSTNDSLKLDANEHETKGTLEPAKQKLRVRLDQSKRAGKKVTLVEFFVGTDEAMAELAKTLKNKCGAGGSVKDGVIEIQGELVPKLKEVLTQLGYGLR